MPVDTAAKRASATEFIVPSYAIGIFPDGSITADDRQAASWLYSGILATAPVAPVVIPKKLRSGSSWECLINRRPLLPVGATYEEN